MLTVLGLAATLGRRSFCGCLRPRGLAWKEHLDKEWVTYLRNRFDENYEIARHASLLFNFVWFDRGGVSRGDGGAGAGDASGGAP